MEELSERGKAVEEKGRGVKEQECSRTEYQEN